MTTPHRPTSPNTWAPPQPIASTPTASAPTGPQVPIDGDLYARARALGVLLPPLPPPDPTALATTASAPSADAIAPSAALDRHDEVIESRTAEQAAPASGLGRDYVKVWIATAISRTGDGITQAALPLLALHLTGDVRHVAWVYATSRLSWLGVSLISGALADRVNRRTMLLVSDLSRIALLAVLGAFALGGSVPIGLLYFVALGIGIGETFYESANAAVIPAIVAQENYERASGRLSAAEVTAYDLVGPAIGAALFSVGVGLPFLLDAVTFVVGSMLIYSLRNTFRDETVIVRERTTLRSDIRFGMTWLWRQPTLRALALMTGGMNFAIQCTYAPLAVFSARVLGLDDWGFGLLLAGSSIGSIVGGIVAGGVADRLGPSRTLRTAIVAMSASMLLAGMMSHAVPVILVLSLDGAAVVLYQVISVSTRMAAVPDHLRGRVSGAYSLLSSFGGPIGAGFGGVVAHQFGLRAPFFFGSGLALVLLVAFAQPLSDARMRAARLRIDLTDAAMATSTDPVNNGPGSRNQTGATNGAASSVSM
ncbi:MAG: MFS transporter [Acidimicrobiia bacterium]